MCVCTSCTIKFCQYLRNIIFLTVQVWVRVSNESSFCRYIFLTYTFQDPRVTQTRTSQCDVCHRALRKGHVQIATCNMTVRSPPRTPTNASAMMVTTGTLKANACGRRSVVSIKTGTVYSSSLQRCTEIHTYRSLLFPKRVSKDYLVPLYFTLNHFISLFLFSLFFFVTTFVCRTEILSIWKLHRPEGQ